MANAPDPSVSKIITMCEVKQIIIDLLNINNAGTVGQRDTEYCANSQAAKILSSWMCDPQRSPEEIYELIGPEFEKLQDGSEDKLAQAFIAAVVHDALGVIYERQKIVLTGHWAKIARCMIKYLYENERSSDVLTGHWAKIARYMFYNFLELEMHFGGVSLVAKSNLNEKELRWILNACNAEVCPDHTLRLELFGFIWITNYFKELTTEQLVEFFVGTISELDFDNIYNNHAHDLYFSTLNLMACFDRLRETARTWGHFIEQLETPIKELTDAGQKITDSLLSYEYSIDIKFLQNILKLTGILAQIAKYKFQLNSFKLQDRLNNCLTLFIQKFRKVFKNSMEMFAEICLHPFIYPYYIGLVANITNSILDLSEELNKWRKSKENTRYRQHLFRRLETRRNYMVNCVDAMRTPINLPPLLLKQELGMLKPTGRADLQRKVLSQPGLPLSFNYSKCRVDFSKYNDNLIDNYPLNLDNASNTEESDNDDDLRETDSENDDSDESSDNGNDSLIDNYPLHHLLESDSENDESSDNGNFEYLLNIEHVVHTDFDSMTSDDESSSWITIAEYETASEDSTDSNASDTDDNLGENVFDMRSLNVL